MALHMHVFQLVFCSTSLRELSVKSPGVNGVNSALHSYPPTCLPAITQWSHSIHRNLCSRSAGNAAVVKPSELSEFSTLLLRALLPHYLDKVWTPATVVDGVMMLSCCSGKALCQHRTVQHKYSMFDSEAAVWGDSLPQQWLILPMCWRHLERVRNVSVSFISFLIFLDSDLEYLTLLFWLFISRIFTQ